MIVSIHIPKTAGTTVGYILDYGFRRQIFYDYSQLDTPRHAKEYAQDVALIDEHKEFIEKKFDIIHGHFYYRKYSQVFPEADYLVCLREPLARTISQYYHILEEADPNHWLFKDLYSGAMDFIDFASLPHIRRAQSIFVEGRDISDYSHIFITEKLSDSIYRFQKKFNFERHDPYMNMPGELSLPNLNPRSARKKSRKKLPPPMLEKARHVLSEDIELYKRALGIMAAE